jgi:hypothetical protein
MKVTLLRIARIIVFIAIVFAMLSWVLTMVSWLIADPGFEPISVLVSAILSSIIALFGWLKTQSFSEEDSNLSKESPQLITPVTENRPKVLQYVLEGGDPTRGVRTLIYGKCQKPPYAQHGFWFVNVRTIWRGSRTFIVKEKYTRPNKMNEFDIDCGKWEKVAHKVIIGDWNPVEECLWEESPFYVYKLPDGTPIRYGYTKTRAENFPDRELWYVVIGLGKNDPLNGEFENVFIVDKKCTEPEFMDKMGSDPERWRLICWDAPVGLHPSIGSQIANGVAPDIYWVFKQDEKRKNRTLWQKMMLKISSRYREHQHQQELLEKYLR